MSKCVQGGMRMVRAASSSDELDANIAKLAGTFVLLLFFFFFFFMLKTASRKPITF